MNKQLTAEETKSALATIAALGQHVRNEQHLRDILLRISSKQRRSVYDRIKPHLQFNASSFRVLMRSNGNN